MRTLALVLCTVALTASMAVSGPVNPESPTGVAAYSVYGGRLYILCTDGTMCAIQQGSTEWTVASATLPVDVHDVAEFLGDYLVTSAGDIWNCGVTGWAKWVRVPAPPCATVPVPAVPEGLGELKATYR